MWCWTSSAALLVRASTSTAEIHGIPMQRRHFLLCLMARRSPVCLSPMAPSRGQDRGYPRLDCDPWGCCNRRGLDDEHLRWRCQGPALA